ncbi:Spy/CpxP family protein refolding chaperone [uncultured Methylophaga sp.]|uniref:Spy/CpxP family protein refolding chaperone n=1 Tax=uncultured Methylophaga sp. TaxID=285271 RepID=UPI002622DE77|nr:Spy/CpxP family protein refolding chaperone [uncultured Methylophaga sp.]
MKKSLILMSLIPLTLLAGPAMAGDKDCDKKHGHHMKHKKAGDVPFYLRDIDLDDSQKAQLKAMMEQRHQNRESGKKAYWENKKAIMELTRAETLDEAALEQRIDQSLAMKKQSSMERARFHHEVYNLLTADQQQQLDAKIAKYKNKHKQ